MLRMMPFRLIKIAMIACCCILLSGCDKRNNREWLENKLGSELSRVYSTKNLEDLFKEFPYGFEIRQVSRDKIFRTEIVVKGNYETKEITGQIYRYVRETGEVDSEETFTFENGIYNFEGDKRESDIWELQRFLVEDMVIEPQVLSQLPLKSKEYHINNGSMGLDYTPSADFIPEVFKDRFSQDVTFSLGGSESNIPYYYSIAFEENIDNYFMEVVTGYKELEDE